MINPSLSPVISADPLAKPPENAVPSMDRIQSLIEEIEAHPDQQSRQLMQECLYSLLEFYGAGLQRVFELLQSEADPKVLQALVQDEVVRTLLFVHDLHPVPLQDRLESALESVRPYLESHGGGIDLVSIQNGIATLRLGGHCQGCPSSSATIELAVRQAIEDACPDLEGLEVEGVTQPLPKRDPVSSSGPAWHILGPEEEFETRAVQTRQLDGVPILLCQVGGRHYAYRDFCPACNAPLEGASMEDALLVCPRGHRFDAQRAGISPDRSECHLDPLPLIASEGMVKVAVS